MLPFLLASFLVLAQGLKKDYAADSILVNPDESAPAPGEEVETVVGDDIDVLPDPRDLVLYAADSILVNPDESAPAPGEEVETVVGDDIDVLPDPRDLVLYAADSILVNPDESAPAPGEEVETVVGDDIDVLPDPRDLVLYAADSILVNPDESAPAPGEEVETVVGDDIDVLPDPRDLVLYAADSILVNPDESAPAPGEEVETVVGDDIDVLFDPRDLKGGSYRNAKATITQWRNGVVPYVFDSTMSGHSDHISVIKAAMADYEKYTCIRFREKTSQDPHYVRFIYGPGCFSYIGNIEAGSSGQQLSLGTGCNVKGTAIHEMMHALGFDHEQSRADRDGHIKIAYENIDSSKAKQFDKLSYAAEKNLGLPYDFESVMHYGCKFFSKNRQPTIVVIEPDMTTSERMKTQLEIGQRYGFSSQDIAEVNRFYNCKGRFAPSCQ